MTGVSNWLSMLAVMCFIAFIWFAYLIRIVLNEEVVQERKRRRMRARELERRKVEDKARRNRRLIKKI